MGDTSEDVSNLKSETFTEVLKWESAYTSSGVYNSTAWSEGWGGVEIWEAFGRGDVYLSFLTQIDCYFLQGSGSKKFLKNPNDLGYSTNPTAVVLTGFEPKGKGVSTGGRLLHTI